MRKQVVVAIALILLPGYWVAQAQPSIPLPQVPGGFAFLADDVSPGDTVATGTRNADGRCVYPQVAFRTLAPEPDFIRSVSLEQNPWNCALTVGFNETRGITVDDIGPAVGMENPSAYQEGLEYKTVTGRTEMIGWGGELDVLTKVSGTMLFQYDGERARIISKSQRATAVSTSTGWVKDGSGVSTYWGPTVHGPADCVHIEYYGDFHWTWLDTYYHTLYNGLNGEGDGLAYCDHAFNGNFPWKIIGRCFINNAQ